MITPTQIVCVTTGISSKSEASSEKHPYAGAGEPLRTRYQVIETKGCFGGENPQKGIESVDVAERGVFSASLIEHLLRNNF
jgi:hypothetical protein